MGALTLVGHEMREHRVADDVARFVLRAPECVPHVLVIERGVVRDLRAVRQEEPAQRLEDALALLLVLAALAPLRVLVVPRDRVPDFFFVREAEATGVMMLPIPRSGVLRQVGGMEAALAVPGIEGLEITIPSGQTVVPLPEGNRYLGFLFAKAETPDQVETALRVAHARLEVEIEPAQGVGTSP